MELSQLYLALPPWAQNVVMSAYGLRLHFQRYGHQDNQLVEELRRNLRLSIEELEAQRFARLKAIIRYAVTNTDFYQQRFRSIGLSPEDITSVDDLRYIPIVTREDIRQSPESFIARTIPRRKLIKETTSGSTGKPIPIYSTLDVFRYHWLFLQRLREMLGIRVGMRRVTFNSRIIMSPSINRPPYWRYDMSENNWHFSIYHMTPQTLPTYYRKIREIAPQEFVGYPSSMALLARFILDNDLPRLSPVAIITSSETLLEEYREVIEQAFQCRVTDLYGCGEKVVFAHSCAAGLYHVHPDYSYLEVVAPSGEPVKSGIGEVVATTLFNYAMPLIRYKVGDLVEVEPATGCRCGLAFPTFKRVTGRKDDYISTPSGKKVYRLATREDLNGVVESQLVQYAPDKLKIRVVKDDKYTEEDEKRILGRLNQLFQGELQVSIEYVDRIPRQPNGKFKFILREIGDKPSV